MPCQKNPAFHQAPIYPPPTSYKRQFFDFEGFLFHFSITPLCSAMDWSCFTTKADFSFNVKLFNCFSFKRCFTTVFKSSKSKRLTAKQKNFFSCRHYSLSTEASIFPASAFAYNYRLPHPFPSFFQNPASNFGA